MKTKTVLLFMLLASSNFMFSQLTQDSLGVNYIYAPNHFSNSFSAEESWEIHKAAYIKQLNSKGLTDDEIKSSMVTYEKDKVAFIARVKEQLRLAAIQRKKAAKQRALAKIEREKAAKQRELAAIQRQKANKQRSKARIQRDKAEELRKQAVVQRTEAAEQRELAVIQRTKAAEQRELAAIQREKAEIQRKNDQAWRKHAENILIKNITLTNQSNKSTPVIFKVTSKTTLRIGIIANISSGTTLVEIYNPNGIKKGELSLNFKSNSNEGEEYTSAALDKTISGAELGEWQIKISSQNSEGTVTMSVAQYKKPSINE